MKKPTPPRAVKWLLPKRKQPLLNPVHLPKFQAEKEKQAKIDSAKFMAALKASRWIK